MDVDGGEAPLKGAWRRNMACAAQRRRLQAQRRLAASLSACRAFALGLLPGVPSDALPRGCAPPAGAAAAPEVAPGSPDVPDEVGTGGKGKGKGKRGPASVKPEPGADGGAGPSAPPVDSDLVKRVRHRRSAQPARQSTHPAHNSSLCAADAHWRGAAGGGRAPVVPLARR